MVSKRKVKKMIRKLRQRNVKGLKQVKYYYKVGKYLRKNGELPEKLDKEVRRGALRLYLYFRNQPLALKPTCRELRRMKEEDFLQLLEDKNSLTGGTLSGTSCDLISPDWANQLGTSASIEIPNETIQINNDGNTFNLVDTLFQDEDINYEAYITNSVDQIDKEQ